MLQTKTRGVVFLWAVFFEIGTQKKGKSNGPENLPGGAPGPVQSLSTVQQQLLKQFSLNLSRKLKHEQNFGCLIHITQAAGSIHSRQCLKTKVEHFEEQDGLTWKILEEFIKLMQKHTRSHTEISKKFWYHYKIDFSGNSQVVRKHKL